MRKVAAVVAGVVAWTVGWLPGTFGLMAAFPDVIKPGEPLTHVPMLLALLVFSVVLSVLAGWVTAFVVRERVMACAWALGIVQLALGVFFQSQSWDLMPLWYHVPFLLLLIPGNVAGALWRWRSSGA
ncbi:MAG: hypothetical protein AAF533_17445 [Acidobacteriota bacterium]